ncbi:TonB-dependent receptor [Tamlana fucoidanivorans]|uniref:TonB-dependent receptor n=1 Tax=Allotamlana fucoidanivorans TaxID=2583814 RepID=A0A5C4SLK5_9FLAO|nr:TonB-dependent receptor [Tamlana fucoidanivorans]TNJ44562.1 TonB-dependent receptor [Tamlana fucoidanivorans]
MKYYIYLMLFFVFVNMEGQNTIQGIITDAETNKTLELVNIYISELEKGTASNQEGKFTINNIPSGNYSILFSMIGYENQSLKLKIPTEETLNIVLNPTAIEMESIIISTPFHKLQSENVMKVEHETIKELRTQGAITLADGISNVAGVENISTGVGIGKPVIRGLSSNRVLVYAQGVRLENQQFGGEHGLGVNDAGIESIEVIKGPASLLYGSDAIGGVLYLNPERFAYAGTSEGDVRAMYFSSTEGFNTSAGYRASDERFKFLFRGSVAEHSDYDTKAYRVTNTRFNEKDFKAGVGYQVNTFKTEFRYNVNNSKLGIPEEVEEQSLNKTPLLPFQDITNHVFSSKSTVFFNDSKLNVNLGYIYNDRKEFDDHHHDEHDDHDDDEEEEEDDDHDHEDETDLHPELQMKLKTANYNIQYHLPEFGKFEIIAGVQGMYQRNTNYGEEQLIPDAVTFDTGIFATSHIHFETFDIQIGGRFDKRHIENLEGKYRKFNSVNGAFGVKTNIAKNLTARVNLATGFRAPNLAELASNGFHSGANRIEIGNPDLNNEENFQTDVTLEYKNKHLEFFINGFLNQINKYIYLSPTGEVINDRPVYQYAQNNAHLYGGEFGFHLHPHPLDWLHYENSFETVTGIQENKDYLPLIPANTVKNTIRVEFDRNWIDKGYAFIKAQSTFNMTNVAPNELETSGYTLWSAGLGGTFNLFNRELTVTIAGTNLTDKTYISHLSRLRPDGIFNMGRNINIGLTYSL